MQRMANFLGFGKNLPEDGRMWHGVDRKSKARIILISLVFAVVAYVISFFVFRNFDGYGVLLPIVIGLFTLTVTMSAAKNKHLEAKGGNNEASH